MDPSLLGRPMAPPTAKKPAGLVTKRTLFIAIGLGIALLAGVFMLMGSGDNSGVLKQRLSARQAITLKIIADGQKNLSDDDVSKLNSELSLILSGDNTSLQAALKATGMKKVDKEITAAEADTATFDKLKSAKLNAQYDATYRGVLNQRLESLQALLKELHGATSNKALKSAVASEYQHVTTYLDTLQKLD